MSIDMDSLLDEMLGGIKAGTGDVGDVGVCEDGESEVFGEYPDAGEGWDSVETGVEDEDEDD